MKRVTPKYKSYLLHRNTENMKALNESVNILELNTTYLKVKTRISLSFTQTHTFSSRLDKCSSAIASLSCKRSKTVALIDKNRFEYSDIPSEHLDPEA